MVWCGSESDILSTIDSSLGRHLCAGVRSSPSHMGVSSLSLFSPPFLGDRTDHDSLVVTFGLPSLLCLPVVTTLPVNFLVFLLVGSLDSDSRRGVARLRLFRTLFLLSLTHVVTRFSPSSLIPHYNPG